MRSPSWSEGWPRWSEGWPRWSECFVDVVGEIAEVVGVIINVVDETAEVVGKVANVVGKVLKGWSTSWCSSTVVPIFPQRHALARQGDRNVGKTPLVIGAMLGIMQFLNGHIDNVAKNF